MTHLGPSHLAAAGTAPVCSTIEPPALRHRYLCTANRVRARAAAALAGLAIWAGMAAAQHPGAVAAENVSRSEAVGLLRGEDGWGQSFACSAVLVGPRLIMSAAGCFYDSRGNALNNFSFVPGHRTGISLLLNGLPPRPYNTFPVIRLHHPARYQLSWDNPLTDIAIQYHDIAFAELGTPLEPDLHFYSNAETFVYRAGWPGLRGVTPSHEFARTMQVGLGSEWGRTTGPLRTDCLLYWSEHEETGIQTLETWDCSTRPLLRGSPAYEIDPSGNQYVVGVISAFQNREDYDQDLVGLAPLTPARLRILQQLRDGGGANTGQEAWVSVDVTGARAVPGSYLGQGFEVYLTNNCPTWRLFAVAHFWSPESESWEWGRRTPQSNRRGTEMPRQGHRHYLFTTNNTSFYLNLHDQGLRNLTRNDIRFDVPDTVNNNMHGIRDPVPFQRFDLTAPPAGNGFPTVELELTSACRLQMR